MVETTEIKLGYKKTRLGWIPDEWEVSNLSKIINFLQAGVSVNSIENPANKDTYGILKTSCVYGGKFDSSKNKTIISNEIKRAKLNPRAGNLIISRMNTPELVGACGYVVKDEPRIFLPDRLWQTVFYKDFNDSGLWLHYLLNLTYYRFKI